MRILFSSAVAATILIAASAVGWKAEAATMTGVGTLPAQTKPIRPSKRLPIGADNIAELIAGDITAMATVTRLMAMPTQPTRITATPTGHTVITATAGDQASASVSDVAGVGATN
jgi:hypothetical protein